MKTEAVQALGHEISTLSIDAPDLLQRFTPDGWFVTTRLPDPLFNLALLNTPQPEVAQELITELKATDCPFQLWVPEEIVPQVEAKLQNSGLELAEISPYMVISKEALSQIKPQDQYQIEVVNTADRLAAAVAIQIGVYELDPAIAISMGEKLLADQKTKTYLISENGQEVCTAMTIIDPETNTAGVWNVATVEDHQRQGFGKAVMTNLLLELKDLGVDSVHLVATEAGTHLYESLGFKTETHIHAYSPKEN